MPTCRICGEHFYRQTEIDPAEPCWCEQMASGSLRDWNGWRGYRDRFYYWLRRRWVNVVTGRISYWRVGEKWEPWLEEWKRPTKATRKGAIRNG